METRKSKIQNECAHDFQNYSQCCYCGAFDSHTGKIIDIRTQGNVEAVRQSFIEWWNGCKETNGGTAPLAMQVFHWFDKNCGIFNALTNFFEATQDYDASVRMHENIMGIKEKERQEWADTCIKKQARIEELEKELSNTYTKEDMENAYDSGKRERESDF